MNHVGRISFPQILLTRFTLGSLFDNSHRSKSSSQCSADFWKPSDHRDFCAAFVASPVIGFVIYAFYNYLYEWLAQRELCRGALGYILNFEYGEGNPKKKLGERLKSTAQRKEFLDLIYASSLRVDEIRISSEIVGVLKNHLNAFAVRVVCGFFMPIFCIPSYLFLSHFLGLFGIHLIKIGESCLSIAPIIAIIFVSIALLYDCPRVLKETFQLEEYFVRSKKGEIQKLAEKLFGEQT